MKIKGLIALLTLMFCSGASAAGSVDIRYADGNLDAEDGFDEIETDRDGFDLRGEFDISDQALIGVSFLSTESDEIDLNGVSYQGDIDLDILRLGVAVKINEGPASLFGKLEFARATLDIEGLGDESENGGIVSLGARGENNSPFIWDFEVGYVKLSDLDGITYGGNIGFKLNPQFALIGGIQGYDIEDEYDVEYDIFHWTIGVRMLF